MVAQQSTGVGSRLLDRGGLLRGLARSHRYSIAFKGGAIPVGAGKPAKKPTRLPCERVALL
ncbi:hypothetical protein D3C76_1703190 [compost metagenome]